MYQEQFSNLNNRLDNALVAQKNQILKLINNNKHSRAYIILEFVKPMWIEFDYEYKYKELLDRIKD